MNSEEQRIENREQIVFESEFDVERLDIQVQDFHSKFNKAIDYCVRVVFYESGSWAHSSIKPFDDESKAHQYGKDVIARYKRLIAAAELAFILGDDRSDLLDQFDSVHLLDADFVKVVRAADEGQRGEGAG